VPEPKLLSFAVLISTKSPTHFAFESFRVLRWCALPMVVAIRFDHDIPDCIRTTVTDPGHAILVRSTAAHIQETGSFPNF